MGCNREVPTVECVRGKETSTTEGFIKISMLKVPLKKYLFSTV